MAHGSSVTYRTVSSSLQVPSLADASRSAGTSSPSWTTTAPIGTSSCSSARSASRRASRMKYSSRGKNARLALMKASQLPDGQVVPAFVHSAAHRNPMPIRLLPLIAALLVLLLLPVGARAADYVPDQVIVKYAENVGGGVAAEVAASAGAAPVAELPGGSEQLEIQDGESVRATIAELRQDPNVDYAVPNWKAHAAAVPPNDPGWRLQWNLSGTYGINLVDAWTEAAALGAPGGRGAVVAVLDSGVAYERRGRYRRAPDLRRRTFVHPWDFIQRDGHPNDVYGHGTHVAGTIAQTTNNGIGTAGIAYNAKIMPLRVLDSRGEGDSAAIARAIRYAVRHRADVINLSLEFPAEVRSAEIPDVVSALHGAHRRGVVVTAAAGNQTDIMVAYPARVKSVIAVGATTIDGCQADYSNGGRDLDVAAPGGGVDAPNTDSVW